MFFSVFDSIQAGVIEELVVLAFVVVTLRQAGRPWWEVTLVALVLRGSYHIYYGPGVFGILVWAALYYWIYLRFRSLIPMMVCHVAWDAVGFLSQRWSVVAGFGILTAVGLWIAAPITWLVERSAKQRAVAGIGNGWIPGSANGMPLEHDVAPAAASGGAARLASGPLRRQPVAMVGRLPLDRARLWSRRRPLLGRCPRRPNRPRHSRSLPSGGDDPSAKGDVTGGFRVVERRRVGRRHDDKWMRWFDIEVDHAITRVVWW